MDTLNEFYDGSIIPAEIRYNSPSYNYSNECQERLYERLSAVLPEEERENLNKLRLELLNMIHEHGRESFITGFSLGMRLTAEGFCAR